MKAIRLAALLLLVPLLFTGCGRESRPKSEGSGARQQVQQYYERMKDYQAACDGQMTAFGDSVRNNDPKAGQAAAEALEKTLGGFDGIEAPEACQGIQPDFLTAQNKTRSAYALMIQILGDGQYTNDDMAYQAALRDVERVIAESYQSGFAQLEEALAAPQKADGNK